jgi:5-methylcytosine-specific restriction endonuclease McrA
MILKVKHSKHRVCEYCRKPYIRKRRNANEGLRFCSRACADQARKAGDLVSGFISSHKPKYTKVWFGFCRCCSKPYVALSARQRFCSGGCKLSYVPPPRKKNCDCCGAQFAKPYANKYCSVACARVAAKAMSRASKIPNKVRNGMSRYRWEAMRLSVLIRDGYICHECGIKTDPRAEVNDDLYPNVDHVIPVAAGGPSTELNLRCCCRKCNMDKHDSIVESEYILGNGSMLVQAQRASEGWRFIVSH